MANEYGAEFSPAQKKVLRQAHMPYNVLCGAVRSGKTHVSYYLAFLHVMQHRENECFFIGKTLNTLDRNVLEPMRRIFGEVNVSKIIDKRYIYFFGKKVWCIGANDDRAVTKIQGASAGYAYCDEIVTFPQNFFEMLLSRLDKPDSILDATCNPESPSHYIKQWLDKAEVQPYLYQQRFQIYDNPFLSKETIKRLEDMYRGTPNFKRWILGEWVKCEGLVYPSFNRAKHYIEKQKFYAQTGLSDLDIQMCVIGGDGATTNDVTVLRPLFLYKNGMIGAGPPFRQDPQINGPLSNYDLMRYMSRHWEDIDAEFKLTMRRVPVVAAVDCAAADLVITMRYNMRYGVNSFSEKNVDRTSNVMNNLFAMDKLYIFDYGGWRNYPRGEFIHGLDPIVPDLETLAWMEDQEKYDPSTRNDDSDALRYGCYTMMSSPHNEFYIQE